MARPGSCSKAKARATPIDALGNLATKTTALGHVWDYVWNAAGHLAEVVCPDGRVVRFTYDALGRRVSKSYEGKLARWVWDRD